MPIYSSDKGGGNFEPAPSGVHQAVCCDVYDLGIPEWANGREKVQISWQIDKQMEDGRPFIVSCQYTNSLNEKANLRKDLEGWKGRRLTAEETKQLDLEELIGDRCTLNVLQEPSKRDPAKVYANVKAVLPPMGDVELAVSEDYTRRIDRDRESMPGPSAADDSTPF